VRQVQHSQPAKLPEEYTKHLRTLTLRMLAKNPDERQGLTLVHFSAQLERFVWDRGCA